MKKDNINWEEFAKALLWGNIVSHKNEDSGYQQGDVSDDIGNYEIRSIISESYHHLTWKELALALGLFTEYLTPDGHYCKICPKRKGCKAYFKDDPDQERCSGWEELQKQGLA